MGKFTIERWQCDRCKKIEDKSPPTPSEVFNLRADHQLEWAGGTVFKWTDMCPACNKKVGEQIQDLVNSADADAKAWEDRNG